MKESRFHVVLVSLVAVVLLLMLACAPVATPAPTPEPAPVKPAWQAEWEKALAEARKEGRVVVYGPPGADLRQALTEGFEKAYPGIRVEYTATPGGTASVKIGSERMGGLYLVDLFVGGAGPTITGMKGFIQPIEQFLILPEVKDRKYWQGSKLEFCDTGEKLILAFTSYVSSALVYNNQMVDSQKAAELSYWDLTRPEWKGKVVMSDPRVPGPGQATGNFFYGTPQLGPDFFRALAKNEVVLGRDGRLTLEWVGRGKYLVHLAPSHEQTVELRRAGMTTLGVLPLLKEGTYLSVDYGSVAYVDKVPHPNAAKVYLNWLLSKEAQTAWSQASGYPSRRQDVTTEHVDPFRLPRPGITYWYDYNEETIKLRPAMIKLAQEIWGK